MDPKNASSTNSHKLLSKRTGWLVLALLATALALPAARSNAGQQFTTGENRQGSYFDNLADGLAGDPDEGEGVIAPSQVLQDSATDAKLQASAPSSNSWVYKITHRISQLASRVLMSLGGF